MKTFYVCVTVFLLGVLALIGLRVYLDSPRSARDYLLSPQFYYELPGGGYVFVEDEYIRYNRYSFNGTLEHQITLNYDFVGER